MSKRGHYGGGSIDPSGEGSWRLRYRIDGQRFAKHVKGTKQDAGKELRRLLREGDTGTHVAPDKVTLAAWIDTWLTLIERTINARTHERYAQLLRCHVVPALGARPLQKIAPTDIDALYVKLEQILAARTIHHVHVVLGACLKSAIRKKFIAANPVAGADAPSPGESDHGVVLDAEQLRTLVNGFRGSVLFPIVATLAFTGARRNEVLALRWRDLDVAKKSLRIDRALEETEKFGLTFKEPKTSRGKRTIAIDDDLIALLLAEREKYLRLIAGVPEGVPVDLSLVRLPDDALMFPNPPAKGAAFSLSAPRNPRNTTKEFVRKASALGFKGLRLHDLRGSHETALLDAGVPVHVVAARCGHDAAILLRSYAKLTPKADTSAAAAVAALSKGVLESTTNTTKGEETDHA
jgi:integrase